MIMVQKIFMSYRKLFFNGTFMPVLAVLFPLNLNAQDSSAVKKNYAAEPVWIKMIDDKNVNYYEAMKAYNEYWKYHPKPSGEEEEEMGEKDKSFRERERETKREIKKDSRKQQSAEELKKKSEENLMKYHVKRFEQWAREVKPFVQDDGRILSDKERMEIWKKQQEETKQQQKK